MMRVLVTGGAGFIGSTTAAALRDAGHDVTVADDLSRGSRDMVPEGVRFVQTDVTATESIEPVVASGGFDACLHFAALIEVGDSMQRPGAYFGTNTAGTARLLDVLMRHDVGRFVFSSTAATYGEPVSVPIDESHPNVPTNPYGESKLMTERMLAWYRRLHGLRSASLRYFNAAGATGRHGERADDHQTHLIPLVLLAASGRRPHVRVFGTDYPTVDGTAVRDYIHVADLADAHVLALDALDPGSAASREGDSEAANGDGRIIANLANGSGFSVREVIAAAEQVTGRPVPVIDEPRRAGDPAVLVASAARARSVLGWTPRRPELSTIVSDAWEHLQRHGTSHGAHRG
jgi:UDP-glucose 4-epimerase